MFMESIAELRKICQTTAKKDKSNVYMRYVCRFLSIYLTRLLLPTKITANQVSFAMIMTGIFSTILFLCPSRGIFLAGAIIFQLWYILDCMDGEVARYRYYQATGSTMIDKRQSSLAGLYYDIINHYIMNFLVHVTIGFGLLLKTQSLFFMLVGIAASLGQVLLLAVHDGKSRAFLAHLKKYKSVEPLADGAAAEVKKKRSVPHKIFAALHYAMTYPTVMNLVLAAALLNFFLPSSEWRVPLLNFLMLGSLVVAVTLITRNISKRRIDDEFKDSFRVTDEQVESPAAALLERRS